MLLPTGDVVIRDEFQTGRENYKDFFYAMVGLAGEGQNFDGNGMYVRFQTGGGSQQVSLGQGNAGTPPQFGGAADAAARQPARATRASCRRTGPTSPATGRSCPTSTARPRRKTPPLGARDARPRAAPPARARARCAASCRPFGDSGRARR